MGIKKQFNLKFGPFVVDFFFEPCHQGNVEYFSSWNPKEIHGERILQS